VRRPVSDQSRGDRGCADASEPTDAGAYRAATAPPLDVRSPSAAPLARFLRDGTARCR